MIARFLAHHGVYSNWGDVAASELSVQNAARLHQTVGPYDRFGWYHPGPMSFYLMAVPYVLMGWNGAGLPVGTALINLVSVVGIVVLVARRAGGTAALATAALLCAFESVIRVDYVTDVWGPLMVLLPSAFFLLLCADFAAGSVWSLVGATAVGTFMVQTDVSTVSVVVPALILALTARAVVWGKAGTLRESLRRSWPVGLSTLGVAALLWALPLWQQLTGHPGNLHQLVSFLLHNRGQHSVHQALSAVANGMLNRHLGLEAFPEFLHRYDAYLALFLLALIGLAVVCWRRQQWLALAIAAGAIPVSAAVWLSLLRVEGPILGYIVYWTRALTLCAGIAAVLSITGPRRPRRLRWNRRARLIGVLVVGGCALFTSWRLSDSASHFNPGGGSTAVTAASTAVERLLPPKAHRVLVCVTTGKAWPTSAGVVANLTKDGRDTRVNSIWLHVFGQQLAPSGRETAVVFLADLSEQSLADPIRQVSSTRAGDLAIGVFAPKQGYVSAAQFPQCH
jgi:hypothetical protein